MNTAPDAPTAPPPAATPKKTVEVMIDIETLGEVILSIGAVVVRDGGLAEEFHQKIDPTSCERLGLTCDAKTALWWMAQPDDARKLAVDRTGEEELRNGIARLNHFIHQARTYFTPRASLRVWCKGASYDFPRLEKSFELCGQSPDWKYWEQNCYRTLKNCLPHIAAPEREGVAHDALDDAKHQARHLIELLKALPVSD